MTTEKQIFQQLMQDRNFRIAASLGLVPGVDVEVKFGHCPVVAADTATDVWEHGSTQPVYIFPDPAGEAIEIVSSDAADTTQKVKITGLNVAGNPQLEEITLNGTTPVAVPGLWTAVNRTYNSSRDGAAPFLGTVLTSGDGSTTANVFASMCPDCQQTSQAIYTIQTGKVAAIINYSTALNKTGNAASAIYALRSQLPSGVFRAGVRYGLQDDGTSNISSDFVIPDVFPTGTRIKVTAIPSANNADVSAEFSMYLIDETLLSDEFLASLQV